MAVLNPSLRTRPCADPPERDVLFNLIPYMHLMPLRDERILPEDENMLYFWNSPHPDFNYISGTHYT